MPDSFGRMESHCFGCEGVFGGQKTEPIARRVFAKLEKARPNDPKVAYLAGYWRQSAGKSREAMAYFWRAVTLDPLYLSAWKTLRHSPLSEAQRDRVQLALLRLDPRAVHLKDGVDFQVQRDFRGLWNTTQAIAPRRNNRYNPQFALKAGKSDRLGAYLAGDEIHTPAEAIAAQQFVEDLNKTLD